MTFVGILLMCMGTLIGVLFQLNKAPNFLANLPLPVYVWWIMAVAGGLVIYFNRRTSD